MMENRHFKTMSSPWRPAWRPRNTGIHIPDKPVAEGVTAAHTRKVPNPGHLLCLPRSPLPCTWSGSQSPVQLGQPQPRIRLNVGVMASWMSASDISYGTGAFG
jgi:hypothetical protein